MDKEKTEGKGFPFNHKDSEPPLDVYGGPEMPKFVPPAEAMAVYAGPEMMSNPNFVPPGAFAPEAVEEPPKPACPQCGASLEPDYLFCPSCGVKLPRMCPRCGAPDIGGKFCTNCGEPFND
ncbi:MAG: zinc ribbon domain-containing protein [Clostridia bacterium]|nr:zinc ribbon domain-containing protein [Clostridia bacterium]